jgi:hypothetical protein
MNYQLAILTENCILGIRAEQKKIWVNFCNLARKKRKVGKVQRVPFFFFLEKMGPSHHTMKEKNLKLPYSENRFLDKIPTVGGILNISTSPMTSGKFS